MSRQDFAHRKRLRVRERYESIMQAELRLNKIRVSANLRDPDGDYAEEEYKEITDLEAFVEETKKEIDDIRDESYEDGLADKLYDEWKDRECE